VARPYQIARARYGEERKQTVTATAGSTAATAHTVIETRLGPITLVRSGANLTGLYYPRHWPRPDRTAFGPRAGDDCAGNGLASDGVAADVFAAAANQLGEYLDGDRTEFELPVRVAGTEFEERVWALVAGIPYGQTTSYGELARRLGAGTDPRDVGAAVGRNPLCILIPCHRVVSATGKLTGYAGGLSRKRALLEIEHARLVQSEPAAAAGLW
jgi:methylated-DNA-[protein]-cysteine S-methyltransferase